MSNSEALAGLKTPIHPTSPFHACFAASCAASRLQCFLCKAKMGSLKQPQCQCIKVIKNRDFEDRPKLRAGQPSERGLVKNVLLSFEVSLPGTAVLC